MRDHNKINRFLTIYLWAIVVFKFLLFAYTFTDNYDSVSCGVSLIFLLGCLLGTILLFRRIRSGLFLYVGSSLLYVLFSFLYMCDPIVSSVVLIDTVALIVVLQLKSDKVSTWSRMKRGWDWKHGRHLYQTFLVMTVILLMTVFLVHTQNKKIEIVVPLAEVEAAEAEAEAAEAEAAKAEAVAARARAEAEAKARDEAKAEAEAYRAELKRREEELHKREEEIRRQEAQKKMEEEVRRERETKNIEEARDILRTSIASISVPQDIGEGVSITKYSLIGDELVVTCLVNEKTFMVEDLISMHQSLKESMKSTFSANDGKVLVMLCLNAHVGLKFVYIGEKSKKQCEISFPYEELCDM